jgi:hypothetical protein
MQGDGTSSGTGPWPLGWREYIDFPEWKLNRVKAKIDTGARTSAIDVAGYEIRPSSHGMAVVELRLALDRHRPDRFLIVHAPVLRLVIVSNSAGMRQERPLIETSIRLGPIIKTVQLTVANRSSMRFPVILGRKALQGDFVVDVGKNYLWGRKRGQRPHRRQPKNS